VGGSLVDCSVVEGTEDDGAFEPGAVVVGPTGGTGGVITITVIGTVVFGTVLGGTGGGTHSNRIEA
jgi:hypothetical protein